MIIICNMMYNHICYSVCIYIYINESEKSIIFPIENSKFTEINYISKNKGVLMLIDFCVCKTGSKLTLTSSKMHQQMKLHGLLINTEAQITVISVYPIRFKHGIPYHLRKEAQYTIEKK